jgi:hypothetical protein
LEEKVAAPVWKTENRAIGIHCADHATPLSKKLALTSTSGGRSVGLCIEIPNMNEINPTVNALVRGIYRNATPYTCMVQCLVKHRDFTFYMYYENGL